MEFSIHTPARLCGQVQHGLGFTLPEIAVILDRSSRLSCKQHNRPNAVSISGWLGSLETWVVIVVEVFEANDLIASLG